MGSVVGPHPYPLIVRDFQEVVGKEAREQFLAMTGELPDVVCACVGGGSNSIGMLSTNGYLYSKETSVTSTAEGGAGLCAAGSSAYAYGYQMAITTTANAAGGFHVCNDGTLYGYNSVISTSGEHSAALRSDRGGGTMASTRSKRPPP